MYIRYVRHLLILTFVGVYSQVMEKYNPNFQAANVAVNDCEVTTNTGAVTVLLTEPEVHGTFGHISMVLHDDNELLLPEDLDNEHYVSFSNQRDAIGVMITGTKADHVQFGHDLKNVTKTVTLYNANVAAMLKKWKAIKQNRQMFDLLEWNCGRTLLEVLNEGYPDCKVALADQLWTPTNAFRHVNAVRRVRMRNGAKQTV